MVTGFAALMLLVLSAALVAPDKKSDEKPSPRSAGCSMAVIGVLWAYAVAVLIYTLRGSAP